MNVSRQLVLSELELVAADVRSNHHPSSSQLISADKQGSCVNNQIYIAIESLKQAKDEKKEKEI